MVPLLANSKLGTQSLAKGNSKNNEELAEHLRT
jgi:hypothetical protein